MFMNTFIRQNTGSKDTQRQIYTLQHYHKTTYFSKAHQTLLVASDLGIKIVCSTKSFLKLFNINTKNTRSPTIALRARCLCTSGGATYWLTAAAGGRWTGRLDRADDVVLTANYSDDLPVGEQESRAEGKTTPTADWQYPRWQTMSDRCFLSMHHLCICIHFTTAM